MIENQIPQQKTPEKEPVPLTFLEVGTCNSAGFSTAGLLPEHIPKGSHVVTVDLPIKYGYLSAMDPDTYKAIKPELLTTSYQRASEQARARGLSVPDFEHTAILADGRELPFPTEVFDRVLFNDVIGDPAVGAPDIQELIAEALRVLKVGGELWIVDDRAVERNLRAMEDAFPSATTSTNIPYVRRDLTFEHTLEGRQDYDRIASRVDASNSRITLITKTGQMPAQESTLVPASETPPPSRGAQSFRKWLRRH